MANLLKPRKAKSDPSFEGFDLSHKLDFTSSCGHLIPVYYDLLIPGDKIDIRCQMLSIIPQLVAPSPIVLDENVDYYFVPLETLYSLFPALLSDTNEDVPSTLFNKQNFKDAIPLFQSRRFLDQVTFTDSRDNKDSFGFDWYRRDAMRLTDAFRMFGWIYPVQIPAPVPGEATSVGLNCLPLLAYQAIWQYFFRDDKRIEFDPSTFNVDDFYSQAGTAIYDYNRMKKFFELRYHPWKKDPYMIASPSPLGGQSSLNHFSNDNSDNRFSSFVQQWLSKVSGILSPDVSNSTGYVGNGIGLPTNQVNSGSDVVFSNRTEEYDNRQSLQQHRIAQAVERLSAIWMQSGKSYQDMMNNLFGAKVRQDISKPVYLGSDSNKIFINEVIANVETTDTKVGEMTGYGHGTNSQDIMKDDYDSVKFTAPCHGIVLGLYSAVPDAYYSNLGVDPINTYQKRNSFPWPQTDELGEQPIFNYEIFPIYRFTGETDDNIYGIKGWLPRFHELKLKANRAIFGFQPGSSLSYWIPKRAMDRQGLQFQYSYTDFYVDPNYLDSILINKYGNITDGEGYYEMDYYSSDPMLHFFTFHSHKASKQSSYGVPKTYFG